MEERIVTRAAIKHSAIQFFDQQSQLWECRYSEPGSGRVLWDRHHSLLKTIDSWKEPTSSRFIDVGCGAGLLTLDLARRGYVGVGVDGAASMVKMCESGAEREGIADRWQYRQADVEHIPYADGSFDAAVCCGVIEYLPDDEKLLREVRRILRPGGRFLLCVTNQYGYSTSLYPLFQRMKRIPGVIRMATVVRGISTGRSSQMMNLPVDARKHRPAQIRRVLTESGFCVEGDRYSGFTLLPGPFHVLFARRKWRAPAGVSRLNDTPLRGVGSFYMVSARATE